MEAIEIKAIEKEYGVEIVNLRRRMLKDISGGTYEAESYRILKQVNGKDAARMDVDLDVALIDAASPGYPAAELKFHIKMLNKWAKSQEEK